MLNQLTIQPKWIKHLEIALQLAWQKRVKSVNERANYQSPIVNNLISFTVPWELESKKIGNVISISFPEALVNCKKYYIK